MSKYLADEIRIEREKLAASTHVTQPGSRKAKESDLELENSALRARIAELETATPTLELVGGEWEERGSWCEVRFIGLYQQGLINPGDSGQWMWSNSRINGTQISNGTAPTREAAIEAAEKALLSEAGKFVRIKQ